MNYLVALAVLLGVAVTASMVVGGYLVSLSEALLAVEAVRIATDSRAVECPVNGVLLHVVNEGGREVRVAAVEVSGIRATEVRVAVDPSRLPGAPGRPIRPGEDAWVVAVAPGLEISPGRVYRVRLYTDSGSVYTTYIKGEPPTPSYNETLPVRVSRLVLEVDTTRGEARLNMTAYTVNPMGVDGNWFSYVELHDPTRFNLEEALENFGPNVAVDSLIIGFECPDTPILGSEPQTWTACGRYGGGWSWALYDALYEEYKGEYVVVVTGYYTYGGAYEVNGVAYCIRLERVVTR